MHHWGKVMNDDLAAIAGKYEELVGRLQQRYGIAKEETTKQVKGFKETIGKLKRSNSQLVQLHRVLHNKELVSRKRLASQSRVRKATGSRTGR